MSDKPETAVVLTSYSVRKQDSIETYFHEWKSIQDQSQTHTNCNGNETDDEIQEKDEQGKQLLLTERCFCHL